MPKLKGKNNSLNRGRYNYDTDSGSESDNGFQYVSDKESVVVQSGWNFGEADLADLDREEKKQKPDRASVTHAELDTATFKNIKKKNISSYAYTDREIDALLDCYEGDNVDYAGRKVVIMPACDGAGVLSPITGNLERTINALTGENNYPLKILFPYKVLGWHWNAGEIIVTKNDNGSFRVEGCAYDSNGGGSLDNTIQDEIKLFFNGKFGANNVDFEVNKVSPITTNVQTGVACGLYAARAINNLRTKYVGNIWDGVLSGGQHKGEQVLRDEDSRLIAEKKPNANFCNPLREQAYLNLKQLNGEGVLYGPDQEDLEKVIGYLNEKKLSYDQKKGLNDALRKAVLGISIKGAAINNVYDDFYRDLQIVSQEIADIFFDKDNSGDRGNLRISLDVIPYIAASYDTVIEDDTVSNSDLFTLERESYLKQFARIIEESGAKAGLIEALKEFISSENNNDITYSDRLNTLFTALSNSEIYLEAIEELFFINEKADRGGVKIEVGLYPELLKSLEKTVDSEVTESELHLKECLDLISNSYAREIAEVLLSALDKDSKKNVIDGLREEVKSFVQSKILGEDMYRNLISNLEIVETNIRSNIDRSIESKISDIFILFESFLTQEEQNQVFDILKISDNWKDASIFKTLVENDSNTSALKRMAGLLSEAQILAMNYDSFLGNKIVDSLQGSESLVSSNKNGQNLGGGSSDKVTEEDVLEDVDNNVSGLSLKQREKLMNLLENSKSFEKKVGNNEKVFEFVCSIDDDNKIVFKFEESEVSYKSKGMGEFKKIDSKILENMSKELDGQELSFKEKFLIASYLNNDLDKAFEGLKDLILGEVSNELTDEEKKSFIVTKTRSVLDYIASENLAAELTVKFDADNDLNPTSNEINPSIGSKNNASEIKVTQTDISARDADWKKIDVDRINENNIKNPLSIKVDGDEVQISGLTKRENKILLKNEDGSAQSFTTILDKDDKLWKVEEGVVKVNEPQFKKELMDYYLGNKSYKGKSGVEAAKEIPNATVQLISVVALGGGLNTEKRTSGNSR